jgi:hypothetical protein
MAKKSRGPRKNPIVRKFGRKYEVLTSDGEHTLGTHDTLAAAQRQAHAAYAHMGPRPNPGELPVIVCVVTEPCELAPASPDEPGLLVVSAENPRPPTYREAHWGLDPTKRERFDVPDPRDNGKMIAWGELVAVTYGTKKGGDARITDYVHTFERTRPMLCYGDKDGRLYVVGGDYKATERGIVG